LTVPHHAPLLVDLGEDAALLPVAAPEEAPRLRGRRPAAAQPVRLGTRRRIGPPAARHGQRGRAPDIGERLPPDAPALRGAPQEGSQPPPPQHRPRARQHRRDPAAGNPRFGEAAGKLRLAASPVGRDRRRGERRGEAGEVWGNRILVRGGTGGMGGMRGWCAYDLAPPGLERKTSELGETLRRGCAVGSVRAAARVCSAGGRWLRIHQI
jgi:hypothetical protein